MKKILFAVLAVFALVSCAKDVETSVQKSAIDFSTSTKYVNRSAVINQDNFTSFDVYAYTSLKETLMSGQTVSYTDATGWTYTPKKYWPEDGVSVNFYSVYPMELENDDNANPVAAHKLSVTLTPPSEGFAVIPGFNFEANSETQEDPVAANSVPDIIYATAVNKTNTGAKVKMQFRHAMAQIAFKIANDATSKDVTYTSAGEITIEDIICSGSYNMPTTASTSDATPAQGTWMLGMEDKNTWSFPVEAGVVAAYGNTSDNALSISDDEDVCFVIPGSAVGSNGKVKVTVPFIIKQGDIVLSKKQTVEIDADWKEGYRYIYTLMINDETLGSSNVIDFDAVVEEIKDGGTSVIRPLP